MRELSVSVVIPLYNKERHIERAIRSVLAQTLPPREIVVVDDGSTDHGARVVEAIRSETVALVLRRQGNAGVANARNAGIALAKGEYVAFLDADDEWRPWHLENLSLLVERYPDACGYATSYEESNGAGVLSPHRARHLPRGEDGYLENYFKSVYYGSPVCTTAVMLARSMLIENGGFLDGAGRGEDLELWSRFSLTGDFAISKKVSAIYHKDSDNRSDVMNKKTPPPLEYKRWWLLPLLEKYVDDAKYPIEKRRWIKEWIRWCDVRGWFSTGKGLKSKRAWKYLFSIFGSTAFFSGIKWIAGMLLRRTMARFRGYRKKGMM